MNTAPRSPVAARIRQGIKACLILICCVLVAPLVLLCYAHALLVPRFYFFNYGTLLALIPTEIGPHLRGAFYGLTLLRCRGWPRIGFGSYFAYRDVEIGRGFDCGSYCVIGKCRVGDNVMLASRASIISGLYHYDADKDGRPRSEQGQGARQHVAIGSNVWIGEGAVVAASVGENSVIGAGAVVVNPIPADVVALGNPARAVRQMAQERKPAVTEPPAS
jgi:acetyltransferase-like isoleucine patch superfamily enzyme